MEIQLSLALMGQWQLAAVIKPSSEDFTHVMQLVVESTGVADRLPVLVPPPQRGGGGLAVGAGGALSS